MKFLAICAFALCAHVALAGEPSSVSTELVVAGEVRQELRLVPEHVRQIAKRRGIAEQGGCARAKRASRSSLSPMSGPVRGT